MRARLWQIADRLISLSAFLGTLGLLAQVLVILTDVVGRYFGSPLTGAQDLTQMSMVIVVFGGMALCDRLNGHISVDIFEGVFPKIVNRIGDVVSPALGAAIFLTIAWTVWESSKLSLLLNLSTNIIFLPKAWFQYAVVVLSVITAIGMILKSIEAVVGRAAPHFGPEQGDESPMDEVAL